MTTLSNKVITILNKKTSMRLTLIEWNILDNICRRENIKRNKLVEKIMQQKSPNIGLTQSVRLFVLIYLYRQNLQTNPIFSVQHNVLTASLLEIAK